jgi:hypothetical protein
MKLSRLTNLVCRHKVPDEDEHTHDDMLSDGGDVGARNLENLDSFVDSGIKVDVIRAHSSGNAGFQILSLLYH